VLVLRGIRRGGSWDVIRWLMMRLVWGLRKSRDASQPVNLWIVNLRIFCHGQIGLLWSKMDEKYLESGNAIDMFLTRFNCLRASIITMSLIPSQS